MEGLREGPFFGYMVRAANQDLEIACL